jgi:CxxC motif-containing protein (DUF1111 family)
MRTSTLPSGDARAAMALPWLRAMASQIARPRVRTALLHDGRAKSVTDAVLQHDGEAAASRRRLQALSSDEKRQLLAFLKTI